VARLKHFTRSLASGYLLLGVNIAYTLAMVPLALAYLDKPVFGIWAVVVQIGVFLQLTDLGMTGAFARILIEYKDASHRREYASVMKTMWMVFCLQGLLIALLGWLISPFLGKVFKIGTEHLPLFVGFLRVYLAVFGLMVAMKVFELTLSAHQRNDLVNVNSVLGFGAGFLGLWLGFRAGWGLWAMVVGAGATAAVNISMAVWQAWRIGLVPPRLITTHFSRARFLEVFDYGKDRFLVAAGYSVLQSAPTFLVTRFLGLEAGAVWSVGTRVYYLCWQLVARIADLAYPALAEMFVRKEQERLRQRFTALLEVSLVGAVVLAMCVVWMNGDFVAIWTRGRIHWDRQLDALLGIWLFVAILERTFWFPVGVSRSLGFMRFVYFAEAILMVATACVVLQWTHSLYGVLAGILFASLAVGIPYSVRRSAQILECASRNMLFPAIKASLFAGAPLLTVGYVLSLFEWPRNLFGLALEGGALLVLGGSIVSLQRRMRSLAKEVILKLRRNPD
jgi:hypothetical protein